MASENTFDLAVWSVDTALKFVAPDDTGAAVIARAQLFFDFVRTHTNSPVIEA